MDLKHWFLGLPVENTFPLTLMLLSCVGNHLEKNLQAFLCPAFSSALQPLDGGGQRNNLTGKFGQKLGTFFLLVVSCPYRIRILSCSSRGRPFFRLFVGKCQAKSRLKSSSNLASIRFLSVLSVLWYPFLRTS